jgi:hypothetical protein
MIPAATEDVSHMLAASSETTMDPMLTNDCDALWHCRQSSGDGTIELNSLVIDDQEIE